MKFYQQIYEKRWEDSELQRVSGVWKVLTRGFFQKIIGDNSRVLDIGCGFCHLLNHLKAKEKVGIDANALAGKYAAKDVVFVHTDDLGLKMLTNERFDYVVVSNFLEHLDSGGVVIALLKRVNELLRPGGRIIILQPNFRLLGPAYFDFIDHKTVLTDRSIEEALRIAGFTIERKIVRFLPYTTKGRIPLHPFLVRLYLLLRPAWYLMGKQSLFIAAK